jgi:hypothetical protein
MQVQSHKKEPASGDWRDRSKNEKVLGLFVGMHL